MRQGQLGSRVHIVLLHLCAACKGSKGLGGLHDDDVAPVAVHAQLKAEVGNAEEQVPADADLRALVPLDSTINSF